MCDHADCEGEIWRPITQSCLETLLFLASAIALWRHRRSGSPSVTSVLKGRFHALQLLQCCTQLALVLLHTLDGGCWRYRSAQLLQIVFWALFCCGWSQILLIMATLLCQTQERADRITKKTCFFTKMFVVSCVPLAIGAVHYCDCRSGD